MSYQVLARKWRPRSFQDMVGQEHILRMLANALEQKRLHHAYLLTGTRGVGKTTLGRILAKCLNCETGITPTPCGTCHICQSIDAGQFLDLYEVDAASRTKVEDTRELLDNVLYPPNIGRYKVYLIDEVHMLSNHSFNALLKTLEEPPEHVKFLLATTDPKRLPITILSRCLQFHLKHIVPDQIAARLEYISKAENIPYELPALEKLAKAADGSMRDALSLLDQAIAYGHGHVKKDDVNAMLGSLAQEDILPILDALAQNDGRLLFSTIAHLSDCAPDFQQILEELISLLHQIAMAQIVPNMAHDESILSLSTRFTPADVQLYYQIALLGRRDLALTPSPQKGFEMTMLRMLAFNPVIQTSTISASPTQNVKTTRAAVASTPTPQTSAQPVAIETKNTAASQPTTALEPAISDPTLNWRDIVPKLELSGMAYALASNCSLVEATENKMTLALSANHQPMLSAKLKERLAEAVSRYRKSPTQLEINITAEELATPAKQQQQEDTQQLATAKKTLLDDPQVKQLLDMYDATLEVSLLS